MPKENFRNILAFVSVTALFFGWGFISANNDPLLTALKAIFELSWSYAFLTQIVSFVANGLFSFPAAWLMNRIGAARSIIWALALMLISCVLMQFAAQVRQYPMILFALFIMAIGITTLQVTANPLIANLGKPEHSHFRLTWAQTFNSLGVVIGVQFGGQIMLSDNILKVAKDPATGLPHHISDSFQNALALGAVQKAFLVIAAIIAIMAIIIIFAKSAISEYSTFSEDNGGDVLGALKSKWALMGALAIGLYVGAEVSIGALMIYFLSQGHVLNVSFAIANSLLASIYWGGALVGRFVGSALLTKIRATTLLFIAAGMATILCLLVAFTHGPFAGFCALGVGFFNSIMFPTIFTITLEKSGVSKSSTSALLVLAISSGAILPFLVGKIADGFTLSFAFLVPMIAYAYITIFAKLCARKDLSPVSPLGQ